MNRNNMSRGTIACTYNCAYPHLVLVFLILTSGGSKADYNFNEPLHDYLIDEGIYMPGDITVGGKFCQSLPQQG